MLYERNLLYSKAGFPKHIWQRNLFSNLKQPFPILDPKQSLELLLKLKIPRLYSNLLIKIFKGGVMSFKINIPVNLNQSSLKNTDKLAFGQKHYFLLKNVSKSIPWFKVTTLSIIIHAQYWGDIYIKNILYWSWEYDSSFFILWVFFTKLIIIIIITTELLNILSPTVFHKNLPEKYNYFPPFWGHEEAGYGSVSDLP